MKAVPLGEIAIITAGQSPPGHSYNENCRGMPFFQGKADFGEVHPSPRKWCTAPVKVAEAGDILISVRAPVGPTNIANERCCIGRGLAAIRPVEGVALRDFMHWAIKLHGPELVGRAQGSTFSAIGQRDLKTLSIPLPPLDEQRRIVGILNRAAKIERLQAQAQKQLGEFIPALFVWMFGDPTTNPMCWNTAHLGEVCAIFGGGTPRRSNAAYFGGSIPWATPTDVTALTGLYIERTSESITETGLNESSARTVLANTVLLTSRATIGYTAIAAVPMTTNQGIANLTCKECLLPEYLSVWLRLRRDRVIQLAGGTTFKEISKSVLKRVEIPLPPLERQYRFANIASRAADVVAVAGTATDAATNLTSCLMSRLLGSVR